MSTRRAIAYFTETPVPSPWDFQERLMLETLVTRIKSTLIYEDPSFWKSRGVVPSSIAVVALLRSEMNKLVDFLLDLDSRQLPAEERKAGVATYVEDIPWDDFNADEREFFADVVSPVIQAAGVDVWLVL